MNATSPEPRGASKPTGNAVRGRHEVALDFDSPYLQALNQGCVVPGIERFLRFAGTKEQFLRAGVPEHVWPEGREYVRLDVHGWDALLRYSRAPLGPPYELFVDWETPDHGNGRGGWPTLAARVTLQDSTHSARQAWRMTQLLMAIYQIRARTTRG